MTSSSSEEPKIRELESVLCTLYQSTTFNYLFSSLMAH